MGLKGDLDEVVTVWSRSPWRVKAYLAISAFLASGSIASLSDTVFRWKGFVSDALSFYQNHISDQLLRLLQFGFPHVPRGASDLLILSVLYVSANLRVAYFSLPDSPPRAVARRAISAYIGSIIALL